MMFKARDFSDEPTILSLEGLCVEAGSRRVLDGSSLNIRRGETLCIVGESGSGKSVTSLAVMGLLPETLELTAGGISLAGEDLLPLPQARRRELRGARMAMIFQEPMTALNPVIKVGDQISEVLALHTRASASERRLRTLDIMAQVHLPDVERIYNSYPHQLSGGQRQRIMIAMALVLEPALLIADEPTTALDVTTQKQILSLIDELQKRHGTAVLFITHDMGVVAEIADTVCVMRQGKIVESGPVDDVFRRPKADYTRNLLRAVPGLTPRPPRDAATDYVLQVRDLDKTYGGGYFRRSGFHAAQDVSFDLPRGRTLGIVGESGSGKSTVARCVMRLIEPSAGRIGVDGIDMAKLSHRELHALRRKIQVVFQDPMRSLNPRLTVGRSLIEGPLNYGCSRTSAMDEARELLNVVGLPADSLERYPHQFSGGQRQRLAIARAVLMRPDILVADEAVSALDVSVQAQVLQLLERLQTEFGIAVVFITHDLRVAAQICDDILVMQRGKVVEHGPTSEVLGRPSHPYTQALIDAAPGRDWDFPNCRPRNPISEAAHAGHS